MARCLYCISILCFSICLAQAAPTVCNAAAAGPFSFDVLTTEKMNMRITHQDGIRRIAAVTPSPEDGPILSTQSAAIESHLILEKLTFMAELSRSCLNDATSDKATTAQDKAWRARLSGQGAGFSWGLSTRHMGPAFMTFSKPQEGTTRSRYDFDSTIDLGPSMFSLSAFKYRDYLDNNELNPVVETSTGAIRYTYERPGAPKLLTTYTCSSMEYIQALASGAADRNTSRTISLGTSLSRSKWSIVPTYVIKKAQEISNTEMNDVDTSLLQITGELRPIESVCFTPQFSFSNTSRSDTRVRSLTRQSAVSGRLKLVPGILDLTTTLSHLNSWARDGSLDTNSVLAVGRVDWSLDRHRSDPIDKSLSIGAHVKRTRDRIGQTRQDEWEARAALTIKPRTALLGVGQARDTSYR